jgi:hypothetical protein
MYKAILALCIILGLSTFAVAADAPVTAKLDKSNNVVNQEVKDAIYYLQNKVKVEDRPFIRFLSTYNVPEEKRQDVVLTTSFVLHSLIGPAKDEDGNVGGYYPLARIVTDPETKERKFISYRRVPDTKTLWWIDLREYGFNVQAFENASVIEPYFVTPVVNYEINDLARLLSGNAVIRMDWFAYHATDITLETDSDRQTKIYNQLVYSNVKEPKTVDEFHQVWGLKDLNNSRLQGNEYAALVTKSENVARHNRQLFGYRTETGWLYQSYDVKNEEGLRDYVESIYNFKGKPPTVFDGGEMFATNAVRMQVYTLYNGQKALVDEADPKLARHMTDVIGDPRVRTAFSCIDCHAAGPIPPENTLKEFMLSRVKSSLKVPDKRDQLRIERTFLNDKFEQTTVEDQLLFAKALLKINGLTPEENGKKYLELVSDYDDGLSLTDVARECGVTEEMIKDYAAKGLQDFNNKAPGRLVLLLTTGEPIPRQIWDGPGKDGIPGTFQLTMITLFGLTEIKTTTTDTVEFINYVTQDCYVKIGNEIVGTLVKGMGIPQSAIKNKNTDSNGRSWVYITHSGVSGWIESRFLQR